MERDSRVLEVAEASGSSLWSRFLVNQKYLKIAYSGIAKTCGYFVFNKGRLDDEGGFAYAGRLFDQFREVGEVTLIRYVLEKKLASAEQLVALEATFIESAIGVQEVK